MQCLLALQHLGVVDPEGWAVWLFHSHPPLGERIEKARGWAGSPQRTQSTRR